MATRRLRTDICRFGISRDRQSQWTGFSAVIVRLVISKKGYTDESNDGAIGSIPVEDQNSYI